MSRRFTVAEIEAWQPDWWGPGCLLGPPASPELVLMIKKHDDESAVKMGYEPCGPDVWKSEVFYMVSIKAGHPFVTERVLEWVQAQFPNIAPEYNNFLGVSPERAGSSRTFYVVFQERRPIKIL